MIQRINLKVMIIDHDFYALRALNSYMAWDRRTRVVGLAESFDRALAVLEDLPHVEYPDVLLFDSDTYTDADLSRIVRHFRLIIPNLHVICLAHQNTPTRVQLAHAAEARAYFLRNEVRLLLMNAIIYAMQKPFTVTKGVRAVLQAHHSALLDVADVLPRPREYPELTERIRQALWLCVIEGMPAQLAADEMGISPHTIRSYIKEGYRILESYDDNQYPEDMSPIERAFMRFTALEEGSEESVPPLGSYPNEDSDEDT
ncbi:MAG: DNA-binding response regulator [Chloroflexi bacterium CFX4]|nr:DNA-binding response regulator [Chloroflexi bacterium CFX4]MDL1921213.1 response regulator transcription factor [Chloroflexi bacterium CFX3]